ncbi:MAG: hypothetical protein SOZ80_05425 [Prevotella sp.]|uniref:hypothetical protein n=1 Tax=Prevotella sp. TaxID=59823 RepID=UPI002A296037|nr:hypothetical protein [Prevotella sp.]MDD7318448.1 hypothetical protein [Prevotellaceae bacterium]MDY4020201.1 hypothetical protein [Prevotella sp.]
MKRTLATTFALVLSALSFADVPPVSHPKIGTTTQSDDGAITMTLIAKKQNYGGGADTRDTDINSPKSINIHPDGSKYYVNSLEGCTTISYDFRTHKKLAVIKHHFKEGSDDNLWSKPSGLYPWRHYHNNVNTFSGKPVESTFSHNGRYLWVPYYRRSFDINAQDPSAVAIIDTKTDKVVRLMETGPLPKMVSTSPDGKTVAISHWGNNTVGLIDISSEKPEEWRHKMVLVVDRQLDLNFPLDRTVDRDNGSGYALRGTVFTPDNRYLIVGCMGGGGGIAVIDIKEQKYLGRVLGMMSNVRHLAISCGYLYLSINGGGMVQRMLLKDFMDVARTMNGANKKTAIVKNWENCKVGTGARTISISPDGRYVFAACNNVSQICVVDTKVMKTICRIAVDSYPVGLDLSADGRYVFVTSQGRSNQGGNAVNIYEVEYKNPPTARFCPACGAPRTDDMKKCPQCNLQYEGMTVMNGNADTDSTPLHPETLSADKQSADDSSATNHIAFAGGALTGVLSVMFIYKRLRRKK